MLGVRSLQRRCRWLGSDCVSALVIVGDESSSHHDRSRVAEGEVVQTELQTLPGAAQGLPDILEDKPHVLTHHAELG